MSKHKEKKRKTEDPVPGIRPSLFEAESREALKQAIGSSGPYHYGFIENFINDGLLRDARDEILHNLHFTLKETDIYKVNQTGDLANMSGLPADELAKLNSLAKVRDALYSPVFRDFISYVTGCGPLSGTKQDLSVNIYSKGCHLLNHDDVIGSRRISYILYMPPPDEPWDPAWGGALRLYPTETVGVPSPDPTVSVSPKWNSIAFFKVVPGHSFHDVEEVYVDKPRLSIQGWFHIPQPGEDGYDDTQHRLMETEVQKATLSQISAAANDDPYQFPKRLAEDYLENVRARLTLELSDDDRQQLLKYIDPSVFENLKSHLNTFAEESALKIAPFLAPSFHGRLRDAIEVDELAKMPKTSKDVPAPWLLARPPYVRRYMYLNQEAETDVPRSETLAAHTVLQELRALFASEAFARLLFALTGVAPKSHYVEARRFRPGLDFTLATTSGSEEATLEATLSITPARWTDDVGGYDLVMAADESDADPAVYRAATDDSAILFSDVPQHNEFSIILRDADLLRFVKYVSRNAPSSRWDVAAEYKVDINESYGDE